MGKPALTLDIVKQRIDSLYGENKYQVLDSKVESQHSRIRVKHLQCGNILDVNVKGFISPKEEDPLPQRVRIR